MSGIAGIYRLDGGPAGRELTASMIDALAHRGPDGTALWSEGPVGLGHALLHTTPESLYEAQPRVHGDAGLVLTADVRLDNRDELLAVLRPVRTHDGPVTDPELILAAYEKWEQACVEHLLGAFAFAIWDRNAQQLFCATDHFAVKPLYYYHGAGQIFLCASEIKALFRHADVPRVPNPLRIADYLLAPVADDASSTFYQDIYALAPAHTLTVRATGVETRCYWTLDPEYELRLPSDKAYAEAFREHFEAAVQCRLRSAFPVGSMLSGGLDSSAVASMAATLLTRAGEGPLFTYSAVFDTVKESDEQPFIRSVVDRYAITPHYFHADQVGPVVYIQDFLGLLDGPLAAGNLYINRTLYRTAGEQGCRVILDGYDGDTTVSHGLGYLRELKNRKQYLALAREVKAFAERMGEPWRPAVWSWLRGPAYHHFGIYRVLGWRRAMLNRRRPPVSGAAQAAREPWREVLAPDVLRRVASRGVTKEPPAATERAEHYRRLMRPVMSQVSQLLDLCGAAGGVEPRYPFFDRRLVAFCLALPPDQKMRRGWTRSIMRRGLDGILPEAVQWRATKSNLLHSFEHGVQTFEQARMDRVLAETAEDVGTFVNRSYLDRLVDRYDGREATEHERNQLFRIFTLALWLQREAHREEPAPLAAEAGTAAR